jgi:peptidoglycan-N-acetylglucosamine deacetylase
LKSKATIVTTSWDDGNPCDLKIAELLKARDLGGTFYCPFRGPEGRPILTSTQIRSLAEEGFELGGHTLSHTALTHLCSEEVVREVRGCKTRLEDILGDSVRMFCYPNGRFNSEVIQHLRAAGFQGARTTRMFRYELGLDPYRMPTSIHAYPNSRSQYVRNLVRGGNPAGLCWYLTKFVKRNSWVSVAKAQFDQALREGGVWHLYGHSWLIEEMALWDGLVEVLDYVSRRENVRYANNGELGAPRETAPAPDLALAS